MVSVPDKTAEAILHGTASLCEAVSRAAQFHWGRITWRGGLTRNEPFAVACEEPINMSRKKSPADTQLSGDMNGTGLFFVGKS